MQQLVHRITEVLGHRLTYFGPGVFRRYRTANDKKIIYGLVTPSLIVLLRDLPPFELCLRVVDESSKIVFLLFRHLIFEQFIYLRHYSSGCALDHVDERFVFSVKIAEIVLSALRQSEYGAQVDPLSRSGHDVRELG